MMTGMDNDKVWNLKTEEHEDMAQEMLNFLSDIESVCRKYNLSISHEDGHGSFIIEEYNESNLRWLANANRNF